MTTATPPRRNWHLQRWLILLAAAMLAYAGWTTYAFRAALSQARALGWGVEYTDPVEVIRMNWRMAFKKDTWLDGVGLLFITVGDQLGQHPDIVQRLNPKALVFYDAENLRDFSALKHLTRLKIISLQNGPNLTNLDALASLYTLEEVTLFGCGELTNVDALEKLSKLHTVRLNGCTGLRDVDGLKNLFALQFVDLTGCTGLTKESVASLKAALPNTEILGP